MPRRLPAALATLSLLLTLTTAAAWYQSYSARRPRAELFPIHAPRLGYDYDLSSHAGKLLLRYQERLAPNERKWSDTRYLNTSRDFLAFDLRRAPANTPAPTPGQLWQSHGVLAVRYWLLLTLSLLPTLPLLYAYLLHHRRTTRTRQNLCPICGYDLRTTPTRCPECGTVTPPATPTP
jgi:hypothetical protein